jgi:hypothetical protein
MATTEWATAFQGGCHFPFQHPNHRQAGGAVTPTTMPAVLSADLQGGNAVIANGTIDTNVNGSTSTPVLDGTILLASDQARPTRRPCSRLSVSTVETRPPRAGIDEGRP